jgi:hypothetical protein
MTEEPATGEDTGLQAVHDGVLTVAEWLTFWAEQGFIFYDSTAGIGPVVLTNGVRSDFRDLADQLAWVARMLPVGPGDDP